MEVRLIQWVNMGDAKKRTKKSSRSPLIEGQGGDVDVIGRVTSDMRRRAMQGDVGNSEEMDRAI